MTKRVLVTGGAGFVGRHFIKRFLDQRWDVVCVDNIQPLTGGLSPETWPLYDPRDYKNFLFHNQDCRVFFKENETSQFDYVFHLAAMVGGREMIEFNPLAVAEDLSIDAEFWNWAKRARPEKTICFSSSAAYPIKHQRADDYILLREDMISFSDDIGMPDMSYGWAKLTHEYIGKLAYERHGIRSVTYRPFSGYGEDQDLAYPFPSICKRVIEHSGAKEISVWGTGDQMRDFIHIDDCVDGVFKTMDLIDNGDAVNLSTGIFTSFKEFASMAAKIVGYDPVITGTSNRPEGVFARGGDTTKQSQLGFKYALSFRDGIEKAIHYFDRA